MVVAIGMAAGAAVGLVVGLLICVFVIYPVYWVVMGWLEGKEWW